MNRIITNIMIFVIFSVFCLSKVNSQTFPPVYLTFITHNEENEIYTYNYYITKRNVLVQMANMVVSKGAKWNFQSDWTFLQAVANYDTGSVVSNTNGKNVIKWLTEDKGIPCDPHAHESQYNYADVAYLHSVLGITPTNVVGGFLYDTIVNGNNWENLENGIYGRVYTSYFWRPDILWGGGTQNHVNDPNLYGAWKPQSMANYFVHDTSKHLTLIGNGCGNKMWDTSNVSTNLTIVRNILNAITNHQVPDTGFYTATIFMSYGQFSPAMITKLGQFIDSMAAHVSAGRVIWKNVSDIYTTWNTTYNKRPFWLACSQLPTGIEKISNSVPNDFKLYQNYPNPFNPITNLRFEIPNGGPGLKYVSLKIYDFLGREVETLVNEELHAGIYEAEWDGSNYSSGVYFYKLIVRQDRSSTGIFSQTKKMILIK